MAIFRAPKIALLLLCLTVVALFGNFPSMGLSTSLPHHENSWPSGRQSSIQQPPSHAIVATIPVGTYPTGIAFNPNTKTLYVASLGPFVPGPTQPGTVHVINGTSYGLIATITVGVSPLGVAVNPATNLVYVADYDPGGSSGALSIINGTTNTLASTIMLGGTSPRDVAVNPSTGLIYVTEEQVNTVAVISGTTQKIVANITVGQNPQAIAVLPASNRILVANSQGNTMSVIDGNTNNVIATLPTGTSPSNVAVNPNTGKVYVSNFNSGSISVFNSTSNLLTGTILAGQNPVGLEIDPSRNLLFATAAVAGTGVFEVINASDDTILESIPVCSGSDVALNEVSGVAYVANDVSNTVVVIDNASRALRVSLQASTTTSFIGFVVTASGTVTGWNSTSQIVRPLQSQTVTIVFSLQNGSSSQSVNVTSDNNGRFSAQWIPTVTGNYLIKAFRPDLSCLMSTVSVSVLPVGTQYIFSVASNSTVSALSFNSTSQVLAFQLSSSGAQTARVDASIAKSLLSATNSLQVLANSVNTPFVSQDTGQSWVVTFTVQLNGNANILMRFQAFPATSFLNGLVYVLLPAIGAAAVGGAYFLRRRSKYRRLRESVPQSVTT